MNQYKKGDWVYFSNLPGTVQIVSWSFPWYLPGHVLYEVFFQGNYYFALDSELG